MILFSWVLISLGFAFWMTSAKSKPIERIRKRYEARKGRVAHMLHCFECSVGWGSLPAAVAVVPAALLSGASPVDPQMIVLYLWPVSGPGLGYIFALVSPQNAGGGNGEQGTG